MQKAFADAGHIDMDRVAAQEARRFLDRVVGYKLSPLLSRKLAQHLSAGRVQSVAVRLIVEREREIQAFKPEEYWKITALLAPEGTGRRQSKPAEGQGQGKAKAKAEATPKPTDEAKAEPPEKPPLPEGAFLAELAEWDGREVQGRQPGASRCRSSQALQGRDLRRRQGRAEGPPGEAAAAVHHQHAAAAGQHPPALSRPSGP